VDPLRIAHVVNEPFGPEGPSGVQLAVYWLARAQHEAGASVAVFSRESGTHVVGGAEDAPPPDRARPARRGSGVENALLRRYFEPAFAAGLLGWRPDIVHFHSVHIPQNVALAAHLDRVGLPYCVSVHGALFEPALARAFAKKALFAFAFERPYLNRAEFVHALTPREREAVQRQGVRRPVVVVPNGLPPDASPAGTIADAWTVNHPSLCGRRLFLFLGRLDMWQKGLDLLIEGFAAASAEAAALVLAGPDWRGSTRALTKRAQRLGIDGRVVFTGPVYGAPRGRLLAAADVFVHPSRWEGVSLSVLAAAAAGTACVLTREADPLGSLERAGAAFLVEPTVPGIAAGIARAAASDCAVLRAMGARGREAVVERFAWGSAADALIDAYRRAIAGRAVTLDADVPGVVAAAGPLDAHGDR
jgi:glycosyltransferase involved in cell wall biosynthesis